MSELTVRAAAVRDETRVGYNTAKKIGGLLFDIAACVGGEDLGVIGHKNDLTQRNSGQYTGVFQNSQSQFYLFVCQYPVGLRRGVRQVLIGVDGVETRAGKEKGIVTEWTAWDRLLTAADLQTELREIGCVIGDQCISVGTSAMANGGCIVIGDGAMSELDNCIVIGHNVFSIVENETVVRMGDTVKRLRNYDLSDVVTLRGQGNVSRLGIRIEDIFKIACVRGIVRLSVELPDGEIADVVKTVDFTAVKDRNGVTSITGDNQQAGVDLGLGHIYLTGDGVVGTLTGSVNEVYLIVELYH